MINELLVTWPPSDTPVHAVLKTLSLSNDLATVVSVITKLLKLSHSL